MEEAGDQAGTVREMELSSLAEASTAAPDSPGRAAALLSHCQARLAEPGTGLEAALVRSLADCCRSEVGREAVLDSEILLQLCPAPWPAQPELGVELCRLVGNLCYDSPGGREAVLRCGLLDKLATWLDTEMDTTTAHHKLWTVLPAALHNFCADTPANLPHISRLGVLAARGLQQGGGQLSQAGLESLLQLVGGLGPGRGAFVVQPPLPALFVLVTTTVTDEEGRTTLLEVLLDCCSEEEVAAALVQAGLVSALLQDRTISQPGLDLLATLSSYESLLPGLLERDSLLYTTVFTWLESPDSELQTGTAALVLGNLATSEAGCLQLLATPAPARLLSHLVAGSTPRLLHAALGCLRNLAVCPAARPALRELGFPAAAARLLLHLAPGPDHSLTPRLTGALRLATTPDPASSAELGREPGLAECLVSLASGSLVPGLAVEAARLLSSVMRYGREPELVSLLVEAGAAPALLSLLRSPHPQLCNEGLVALSLACTARPPRPGLLRDLDTDTCSQLLVSVLSMEQCPPQVKQNCVSLVRALLEWNNPAVTTVLATPQLAAAVAEFQPESDAVQELLAMFPV